MHAYLRHKARKRKANVSAFASLIATPGGATFVLPANARMSFASIDGATAGTLAATLVGANTRQIETPLMTAGERVVIDNIERGVEVTLAAGFEAHVDVGLGRWAMVAENP